MRISKADPRATSGPDDVDDAICGDNSQYISEDD